MCVTAVLGQGERSVSHILADFKAGKAEFRMLLHQEMVYPSRALENKVEGKVGYVIHVSEEGEVTFGKKIFSVSPALDREAKRLISMTLFEPASMDGIRMASTKQVVVRFNIDHYEKHKAMRTAEPPIPTDSLDFVYQGNLSTEVKPIIPAGFKDLNHYIYSELKYPKSAYANNMSGITTLEFIVEKSGSLTNFSPVKYLGGGCYEEAKRVLRSLSWKPATVNGDPVRTMMTQKVVFKLD